jgi:multidrug efflux system membrane fusion protein
MMKPISIVLAAVLAMLLTVGCSSAPRTAQAAPETVSGLEVSTINRSAIPDMVEAIGSVRAAQTTDLSAQIMGNIVALNVREGDRVRAGQVLAVIDDAQPRAAVDRAQGAVMAADKEAIAMQSDASLAESTFKRYDNLRQKNSVSAQEFDEVKARMQAAQARLELAHAGQQQARAALAQANSQLGFTRVRAPFDGLITAKRADLGMVAAPGMPLLTIEDTRHYQLIVTVDESDMAAVKSGATVPVSLDSSPTQLTARVAQIVPAADPGSHSFTVKLDLAGSPDLRSGLFGRARFAKGTREALVVPASALVVRGQLQNVYVVGSDGAAALRYVTVANAGDKRMEVLSGLEGGEKVVVNPGSLDLAGKVIR